ncbi:MAG: hypothetical protein ACJAVI_003398 [Candidatus Azotimanducaceae bacterium]|jgi:hypothetical protein
MADQFESLNKKHIDFIQQQHIYFVASAAESGRVNLSPKGTDTLRILDDNRAIWLNLTGSGNETAAHLLKLNRITLMFCSFERQPLILRLYGTAKVTHQGEDGWLEHISKFENTMGARQIFEIDIEMVQTSCGYAVPFYEYKSERGTLDKWSEKKGQSEIEEYWQSDNAESLDGFPTGINDSHA